MSRGLLFPIGCQFLTVCSGAIFRYFSLECSGTPISNF